MNRQLEQLLSAKNQLEELAQKMRTHLIATSSDILFWARLIKRETEVIERCIETMRSAEVT